MVHRIFNQRTNSCATNNFGRKRSGSLQPVFTRTCSQSDPELSTFREPGGSTRRSQNNRNKNGSLRISKTNFVLFIDRNAKTTRN